MSALEDNVIEVVSEYTAGDPMREEVIWTSLTPGQIAEEVSARGTPVCRDTAQEVLETLGYRRRQAQKTCRWALIRIGMSNSASSLN
jgi:hypothetical protein